MPEKGSMPEKKNQIVINETYFFYVETTCRDSCVAIFICVHGTQSEKDRIIAAIERERERERDRKSYRKNSLDFFAHN